MHFKTRPECTSSRLRVNFPRQATIFLLPASILLLHTMFFRFWIVDDAGIVFAYARNVATGYGLVAQPHVAPVEAYSSPLWLFELVPFFWIGAFKLELTPKLVSLLNVVAGFLIYCRASEPGLGDGRLVATASLSLLALQSGFVIWCASGLENGAFAFLLLLLLAVISDPRGERPTAAGLVVGAISLTRPEGVLFSLAYPVLLAMHGPKEVLRARALVRYALGFLPLVSAYVVFRVFYFGEFLPNTYYAKGGPTLRTIHAIVLLEPTMIEKVGDLSAATLGVSSGAWFVVLCIASIVWLRHPLRESRRATAILTMLGLSTLSYLLLPYDWMGEYRFATGFFLCFYLYLGYVVWFGIRMARRVRIAEMRPQLTFMSVMMCVGMLTAVMTIPRSIRFATNPVISVEEVIETARRFERMGAIANVEHPSLLIADVGGALFASHLRIYDLGMLSDRTIAHALGEGVARRDQQAFYDYIFERARPTFVATRAYHSWISNFDGDQRFRQDYVAIVEYRDDWIWHRYGSVRQSGDFIRREIVEQEGEKVLDRLRQAVRGTHYVGCTTCD